MNNIQYPLCKSRFSYRSHISTGPINIPGSPQRQSSSGTNTDEEDVQLNSNDPSLLDENVNIYL
jgi:hypothetical protein